jgi:AraC-like DNA-binding protein
MYFTTLPNHQESGFDEQVHFSRFKKHNIIFNAKARKSHCAHHVGCLSIKTVRSGEEWYGIGSRELAVRPGQFLILNDGQDYSSRVDTPEETHIVSIFFMREFAQSVFHDVMHKEDTLLDNPFDSGSGSLEFFQTLYVTDFAIHEKLQGLLASLTVNGYEPDQVNEHLVFLLSDLIRFHKTERHRADQIQAVKRSTQMEIHKRLCVVKDFLHSHYMEKASLADVSREACLSVPQLIRQFKNAFQLTPHQYLTHIRLSHAARLLQDTATPVHEITRMCGFDNVSAFCRAFKTAYSVQPTHFRAMN